MESEQAESTRNYYLIEILLGDPSDDGHGKTEIKYFKTNKSHKEINNALNRIEKNIGFDIFNAFDDYSKNYLKKSEYETISLHYNIDHIFELYDYPEKNRKTGETSYTTIASIKYGDINNDNILFEIAKLELKDLEYEKYIIDIDGTFEYGYGFFN